MTEKLDHGQKRQTGYGSSYRKGTQQDLENSSEISTVLGGQVWMVKPDKNADIVNPCIWMQAGAVEFKNCNNFYDCTTCKYDLGMQKRVEVGKQTSWQDIMKRRPGLERICRHSLTNRIARRSCAYDYECAKCDFDQFFEEVWTAKTKSMPNEVENVKGFDVPTGYYFHNGHTWARIESGGYIRIGLDDFAFKVLGSADALDLPTMGKELHADKKGWGFRRQENSADVLSPVNGVITEVNSNVRENPEQANCEPYGQGWLFLIRTPDIKKAAKCLMDHTESLSWMSGEVGILENMIQETAGPLAADGGFLAEDIYGNLPGLGWTNLTKAFLKT